MRLIVVQSTGGAGKGGWGGLVGFLTVLALITHFLKSSNVVFTIICAQT